MPEQKKRSRIRQGSGFLSVLLALNLLAETTVVAFSVSCARGGGRGSRAHSLGGGGGRVRRPTFLSIIAPPGSGYSTPEDEVSTFPDTYDPMMEYPGTMRPGRTPENMPFQDLPIADDDPDPVPWPHFQQIEWHHRWDPPHEHPIPMEEFIELAGRWATPEMEAAMRAGVRRGVRERRQEEEADKRNVIITDDDDEDDELGVGTIAEDPISLGDGVFGQLGSDADRAATAAAVDPANQGKKDEEDEDDDDGDLDDFLLDLGLDADLDDDDNDGKSKTKGKKAKTDASFDLDFDDDDDDDDDGDDDDGSVGKRVSLTASSGSDTTTIDVDDDEDMVVMDDDDELEGDTIPLDDFNDDSDALDTEDIFDEGGFDFDDDYGDMDGGDMW